MFCKYTPAAKAVISAAILSACISPVASAQHAHLDDAIEHDEIVVTGSPLYRSVDEAITGLSVLSSDELSQRLATTIGETLKYEPGVTSTQFGAGASRPIIRGQSGDRVRVLTNGIGSIDASSASPDHAVAAEPAQAERIEVLRGASLLRYGSSGSGGVVNVIDGRIPTQVPEDGFDCALRAGLSSVDDGYDAAGSVDIALSDSLVLHLDGTYKSSEDYDIPGFAESAYMRALEEAEHDDDHDDDDDDHEDDDHDEDHEEEEAFGTLENSAVESQAFTAGLSYVGDRASFGFAIHDFQSDYGIPGGHEHHEEEHDEHDEDHDEDEDEDHDDDHDEHAHEGEEEELVTIGLEQQRIDFNGSLELDGFFERVQIFGGYADYTHTEFEGDEVGTVFTNEGYELRAELIQAEQDGWQAAYGLQIRSRDFSAIGDEAFVDPTLTEQVGLYTFHEKEIGDWHFEGAARFESTEHDNPTLSVTKSFDGLSLSAGADYHSSENVRVGGTVFRTERAPTTEELFSNGPHLATSQFERGDATLDLETALGAELAFRYRDQGRSVSANVFYTDYDDYIFELATDEIEDELVVYQYQSADAQFSGIELQGDVALPTVGGFDLTADAQASYVRAKTQADNLPRIPPISILAGLQADNGDFNLRGEIDYAARARSLAAEETPSEEYALVNLFATWHIPSTSPNRQIDIVASLQNAFDEEARQHTSFLKDVVPLPGRNFRLSARLAF